VSAKRRLKSAAMAQTSRAGYELGEAPGAGWGAAAVGRAAAIFAEKWPLTADAVSQDWTGLAEYGSNRAAIAGLWRQGIR
jgi:hypothetical protein